MTGIKFNELDVQSAKNFRDMFTNNNVYVFLGKNTEWSDEEAPDTPDQSDDTLVNCKQNILYLKKVSYEDTIHAIPLIQWQDGVVYDEYSSSDDELIEKNFYVMTSSNNVYKCISNNDGAVSTNVPSGTSINEFITSDGYRWKFIFNISEGLLTKFKNSDFIPVPSGNQKSTQQLLVENNASYISGSPEGGHGKDALSEMFAKYIIVYANIDLSSIDTLEHRQYGLIINPQLEDGTFMDEDTYLIEDTTYDEESGKVLTLTNHLVFTTNDGDNEKIQIIVKF